MYIKLVTLVINGLLCSVVVKSQWVHLCLCRMSFQVIHLGSQHYILNE